MTMSAPEISVVVRTYNRADRVCRAVDSARQQQNAGRVELVVVDDGSTDGTDGIIAERYLTPGDDGLPPVRFIPLPHNRGAGGAAMVGLRQARAPLVAYLDSDDSYLPGALAALRQQLDSTPAAALAYGDYVQCFEPAALERVMACGVPSDPLDGVLRGGFIHSQSMVMMRRNAAMQVGGFGEQHRISHDLELWGRLALAQPNAFVHVPRPLVRYALSGDGVTQRNSDWHAEAVAVVKAVAELAGPDRTHDAETVAREIGVGIIARQRQIDWLGRGRPGGISAILLCDEILADDGAAAERALSSLASIRDQSLPPIEIIVAGRQRTVVDAAAAVGAGDVPLRTILLDGAAAPAALFRAATVLAGGKMVAPLRAGDRWHPDRLSFLPHAHAYLMEVPPFAACDSDLGTIPDPWAAAPTQSSPGPDLLSGRLPARLSAVSFERSALLALPDGDPRTDGAWELCLYLDLIARQRTSPIRIARAHVAADPPPLGQDHAPDWIAAVGMVLQRYFATPDGRQHALRHRDYLEQLIARPAP